MVCAAQAGGGFDLTRGVSLDGILASLACCLPPVECMSVREINVRVGGGAAGIPREGGFDLTRGRPLDGIRVPPGFDHDSSAATRRVLDRVPLSALRRR